MEPYIGQIQPYGFNFAPRGWAKCDGTLLPISQYTALFSLLGTTYGGDGRTTFGLPDLRGRNMIHQGNGPGLPAHNIGQRGGRNSVNLDITHMPSHNHLLVNGTANVVVTTGGGSDLGADSENGEFGLGSGGAMPNIYAEAPTGANHIGGVSISGSTSPNGGNQGFDITNPYLTVNVCIALQGLFPPRS